MFTNWIIKYQKLNNDFVDRFIFSDEADFHLDGFVNRHNSPIWGVEKSPVIVKKKPKVSLFGVHRVWGDNLTNFLWKLVRKLIIENVWFQQDGAIWHTSRETLTVLHKYFAISNLFTFFCGIFMFKPKKPTTIEILNKGLNWTLYQQNTLTFIQNHYWKSRQKKTSVPLKLDMLFHTQFP